MLPGATMKSLVRTQLAQALLARLIGWYLAFALRTTRWTVDGAEHLAPFAAGASVVFAFWHEHLPSIPALVIVSRRQASYRAIAMHTLVSHHRDGRFIGDIVRRFGIHPVYGSSSRGGAAGFRQLKRLLEQGAIIGITPDGPRGPRRQPAPGVAQLAALGGVPVLPCAARTVWRVQLRTWDRMTIPLPFGRGALVCGPTIDVDRAAWSSALPAITEALNRAADRADRLCLS